jgi:hypothetical protein
VALKEYLEEYLKRGWISPSTSPAAAPVLFVKKQNSDKLRLCVDYRALNAITIKNRYPTPLFDTLLNQVRDASYFVKLDLAEAFHRLRIRKGDEYKTAFKTRYGLYQYNVMPFGLCNAPATFQAFVDNILAGLIDNGLVAYADDILIYGNTYEEVVSRTRECLERLRKAGLFVKLEKCQFHVRQVSFLGFTIGDGKVEMDPERVKAIQEWPRPEKLRNVQEFLGFANFYRRFIYKYSHIAKGLTDLLKKSPIPFTWTEEAEKAFQALKAAFGAYPVLRQFDPTKQIFVEPDASIHAIGAILSQLGEDGRRHPIAYYSRKFTPEESRYGTPDQELLAVVFAMEHWRHFLEGAQHQVIVLSDHNNLRWFNSTTKLSRRQTGLWLKLSKFDYVIHHRPGDKNPADALSRRFDHAREDPEDQGAVPFLNLAAVTVSASPILNLALTTAPEAIRTRYEEALEEDDYGQEIQKDLPELPEDWQLINGTLYFQEKIYVPKTLRTRILTMCHDTPLAGHYGQARTAALTKRDYYWPQMSGEIKAYVQGCHSCARNKHSTHGAHGLLAPHPVPEGRWTRVGLDFIVGLPKTKAGNDTIFVMIDAYTKMAHFEPTTHKGLSARKTAEIIRERLVRYHGVPKTWITDRGTQFVNSFTRHLCKRLNIDHFPTTAYHPSGDGQTERVNAPLEAYLRAYINYAQDDWDTWLGMAEFAYNNSQHSATGMTPFYADSGRHPNMNIAAEAPGELLTDAAATIHADKIADTHAFVTNQLTEARERMGQYYDQHRRDKELNIGDRVWLKTTNIRTRRECKKLDARKIGPFEITKRIGPLAYRLDLPETLKIHNVFHIELLEPVKDSTIEGQPEYPQGPLESTEDQEWEVKGIIDSRIHPEYGFQYRVAWEGDWEPTWEPPTNCTGCPELVTAFHVSNPDKPTPEAREFRRTIQRIRRTGSG